MINSQSDSVIFSGGMSEDQTNSAIEKLKNIDQGKILNLELHNIMENPRLLKLLNENIKNEKFNNLSIVNSNGKQIDLKDVTSVLIDHISDLTSLIKHIKGIVHICSYKSPNNKFMQKDLVKIRDKIDQRIPMNLNIIEERPFEEDDSKLYEDEDGATASMKNDQSNFS